MSRPASDVFNEMASKQPPPDDGIWDYSDREDKATKVSQWGLVGSRMYKGYPSTQKALPSGIYSITTDRNDDMPVYVRKEVKTDDIIRFKDSLADKILTEIDVFWEKEAKFKAVGFLHRRGYLLYGSQGTGKSSLLQQIMSDVVERGGIVFICDNPKFFNLGLATFRQAEPERNMLCIFEDIDAIISRYGEDELLSILDGANMVDKVLNIATTNYPEKLDKRIVSRPRRFDRVIKVLAPDKKIREEFLKARLPKGEDIKKWVRQTKDLSFAGITEVIISVHCLGNDMEETLKIIRDIETRNPSSDEFGGKVGFSNDKDNEEDD